MIKPIADTLDSTSAKEILYRCPKCNTNFAMLGDRIKYCYNCGCQIDWRVYKYISRPVYDYEQEQQLMSKINELNKYLDDSPSVYDNRFDEESDLKIIKID
jgi:hypothetical protein